MTTFNLAELIARHTENNSLHAAHINPQFAKVLRTIGFDRSYTHAEGAYLYDQTGRRYLDFLGGYAVFNIGRNHPKMRDALRQYLDHDCASLVQMDAPLFSGLLAEALKKRVPASLDTVYFTNSGTEGIETAIKFAHCATKRSRLLYCQQAFHGLTNGSLSLNGCEWFREGFSPLLPSCTQIALNDLNALEAELANKDVAAFVLELVQGKGVFIADNDYLHAVRALCDRYGTLLVFDEVQTGFGRTGKMFAMDYSGVTPDILVLSKALSGGYVPVGAVMTKRDIYSKVFSSMDRCVVHSSTFGQGDFAMIAGLAAIHIIEEEKLVENAAKMGDLLLNGLREIASRYEIIREVRGQGLMIGIEFGRPKSLKLKMAWDLCHKLNPTLFCQAIVIPLFADHGILTQVAGHEVEVIKLIPPLTITQEDVSYFLTAFAEVVEKSQKFPGPIWDLTTRLAKQALSR